MCWILRKNLLFMFMVLVNANYYVKYPNLGYYKVYNTPAIWADALKTCTDEEATICVPNSITEKEKVVDLIRKELPTNLNDGKGIVFLGFHNLFNEDELDTAIGGKFPEFDTETREEIYANRSDDNAHCGAMYTDGTMTLRPCTTKFPFVCEKPLWRSYELAENNNYYKLYTEAATWSEALRTCEKDGAHLAVVSTSTEASILGSMIKRYKTFPSAENDDFVAVGAHDIFKTGEVRSVLGKKVDMNILPKDGVRLENDNCVYIKRESTQLYYGDCNLKFAFICEQGPEIKVEVKVIQELMTQEDCEERYDLS